MLLYMSCWHMKNSNQGVSGVGHKDNSMKDQPDSNGLCLKCQMD